MLASSHHSPLLGLAAALLLSCSSTQTLESAGACIEGQSAQCTCSDGTPGFRTCGRDSEYGACDCSGQLASGSGGMQSTGGSAGNPIAGSSGVGGTAGSNPIGGAGGAAGMAGAGGSAGGTTGGEGGMIGGMTGGSAGIGGASATGGVGGTDPMGGQTGGGEGGEGGDSGPGREPQPGELYGDCHADGACDDTLLCVNDSSGGLTDSYCTTTCDALAGMSCPRVRGEPMATCLFGICVR
jgi:hypothetical protein